MTEEKDPQTSGERGRDASRPAEIPATGWLDILWRVRRELARDNMSLIAAGLALYGLLAAFPALVAGISLYGLFSTPREVLDTADALFGLMPAEGALLFREQMEALAERDEQELSAGALLGVLVALWSARKGMNALISATNVAYEETETRGFLRRLATSLLFTIGAVLAFVFVVLVLVAAPFGILAANAGPIAEIVLLGARWILLWLFIVLALAVVYRFAPHRANARWRWVTWGSAVAATLWIAGSGLFALYVRNFGSYGETYGAVGGVVVLLLWFFLSAYVILFGAELNAELEHQTARDTTTGPPKPLGERGAYVADTVGRTRRQARRATEPAPEPTPSGDDSGGGNGPVPPAR